MHYVYLLQSKTDKKLYIGCTKNLVQRLKQHNSGLTWYDKQHLPWKLVYFEGYLSQSDAYSRERSLKFHAQGLRRLKERLHDSLRA